MLEDSNEIDHAEIKGLQLHVPLIRSSSSFISRLIYFHGSYTLVTPRKVMLYLCTMAYFLWNKNGLVIWIVAPELVCFCFCICICICFLFPPNVYSALLNATFFTHIWPTFWIYHFYTIISKFFGIKINFSTFMSWSIYFIAFLTIFVPQWEAIFYIFLFF